MTNPKTKHFSSRTGFLFTGIDGDRNEVHHRATTASSQGNRGMAEIFDDDVILNVVNVEPARIVGDAGGFAVVAFEPVPADISDKGGVSRISDPDMIDRILAVHQGHGRGSQQELRRH